MNFEEVIKKLSAIVASFVVFFLAAGMYLAFKGFVMTESGELVLVRAAHASSEPLPGEHSYKQEVEWAKARENSKNNFNYPKNHVLGKRNAPVAIYEYSSLGCFHCADLHLDTLPKIKEQYIDTGKVKLIYADFPLDKKSMQGAMLARCMPKDKYYDFLNLLYKKQREWSSSKKSEQILIDYAALNGLSKEKAESCLKDDNVAKELIAIRQDAIDTLKIQGTPSLLISTKKGYEVIHGARNFEDLKAIIDEKLAEK